jgi:hypothetical protein
MMVSNGVERGVGGGLAGQPLIRYLQPVSITETEEDHSKFNFVGRAVGGWEVTEQKGGLPPR